MEIIKIGVLGVAGVMLALQFKSGKTEYGFYIGAAICLVIFTFSMNGLTALLYRVKELERYLNGSGSYLGFLFKAVGVTYVCEFCASICKDAGYGAVAGQIETFGKLSILAVSTPVILSLFETIESLLG